MLQSSLHEELRVHIANKPKLPKHRSLILSDITPEAIAWHLHTVHRSAGLMSDEGGQILNGRAADQLPMLNVLWDGGELKVGRKDSESFTVRDARFTVSIMLQHGTFRKFLDRRGQLARDNGFLARALICAPLSIQGQRRITSIEVATFPMLEIFQLRLTELLKGVKSSENETRFKPHVLDFCDDAKVQWVDFANHIENHLNPGGFYCQVRDAASKTAENVARVAALFHVFQGRTGDIQRDTVDQAIQICEWYLREFVRIFCPTPPIPQEQLDALTLDAWLRNHFNQGGSFLFKRNVLLQLGPHQLRSKARLNPAIELLCHAGKIRLIQEPQSRAWFVELYPHSYPYTIQ